MDSAIGIDIGGTHLRAARVGRDGVILAAARDRSSATPAVVLERVEALASQLDDPTVTGIGVGVPGRVDFPARRALSGGYVDLSQVPLAGRIEERFGRPAVVDNDCAMALVAEAARGAGRGASNLVMLTIGTGIGGAAIEDGRILRGRRSAGQFGHLSVDRAGLACLCGKRGCVETVSSGTALARYVREAGLPAATTGAALLARRSAGDALAARVLHAWAEPLRTVIDDLVAALDPELVILGGGLGATAVAAMAGLPAQASWFAPRVAPALLGDEAGVIGAALSAVRASRGRRLVLVNGVPASGKSRVARELSDLTGWPVLSLDTVKNPFLSEIEGVDRPFNRKLGRASMAALFAVAGEAPAGSTVILDAWFGFQPREWIEELLEGCGAGDVLEIWCAADPQTVGDRYAARAESRPPGHPGPEYVPELMALAARAAPLRIGRLVEVDTRSVMDPATLRRHIQASGF